MEKFMLLIREDLNKLNQLTDEEQLACIQEMTDWCSSLAGNYVGGEPLLTEGRYVSKTAVLSDGPFIESKEGVSGYIIITAENLDQAAAFSQTCPVVMRGEMVIEVRQLMDMTDLPKP